MQVQQPSDPKSICGQDIRTPWQREFLCTLANCGQFKDYGEHQKEAEYSGRKANGFPALSSSGYNLAPWEIYEAL